MPSKAQRKPGHSSLRRGRTSKPRQSYLVTFATFGRVRHFADFDAAMIAARAIEDSRLWTNSRLGAWVLMPDHWHGLITLRDRDDLSTIVQRLKTNVARQVRATRPDIAKVWAVGFHDHALRVEEAIADAMRYIIRNPVECGLVERVGDYPFWNATWD